jgi:hypothetical protein
VVRAARRGAIAVIALTAAIQLVPYGHARANPPVVRDATWPDAAARRIAVAACYDCHSNQTRWPWYSRVAPSSWYVRNHVDEGRSALNFSEWQRSQEIEDLAGTVRDGSMPPRSYTLIHPDARLSASEKAELVKALRSLPAPGRP